MMFRGFENLLIGKDPRDAAHITQRICGVCPTNHAMAACLAMEAAAGLSAPANARIIRNLILGADFLHSHILHFYHLALPELHPGAGDAALDAGLHRPTCASAPDQTSTLVDHYLQALASAPPGARDGRHLRRQAAAHRGLRVRRRDRGPHRRHDRPLPRLPRTR